MAYDFKPLKSSVGDADAWLAREYAAIRTGRATPAILDGIMVEAYGTRSRIRDIAAISVEDPRTLRVSPWDASQGKDIATAITTAGLGLAVAVDDKGVRVSFPTLTDERRQTLIKLAKEKLEEARKKLRTSRDDTWKDIQTKEKEGGMSEDEKFRLKDEMEKIVHAAQEKLGGHYERKEKEVSE